MHPICWYLGYLRKSSCGGGASVTITRLFSGICFLFCDKPDQHVRICEARSSRSHHKASEPKPSDCRGTNGLFNQCRGCDSVSVGPTASQKWEPSRRRRGVEAGGRGGGGGGAGGAVGVVVVAVVVVVVEEEEEAVAVAGNPGDLRVFNQGSHVAQIELWTSCGMKMHQATTDIWRLRQLLRNSFYKTDGSKPMRGPRMLSLTH